MRRVQERWKLVALGWATFGIMLVLYTVYFFTQYVEFSLDQIAHGSPVHPILSAEYVNYFLNRVLEAISGESYQIWATVIIASVWVFSGSAESRDGDDELNLRLEWIMRRMDFDEEHFREEFSRQLDANRREHRAWKIALFTLLAAVAASALIAAELVI